MQMEHKVVEGRGGVGRGGGKGNRRGRRQGQQTSEEKEKRGGKREGDGGGPPTKEKGRRVNQSKVVQTH